MRPLSSRSPIARSFAAIAALMAGTISIHATALSINATASDLPWPDRHGPTHNGHVAPSEAADLPTDWNESTGTNIDWRIDLQGTGHSTPVIGDGRLWFTAATPDGREQYVYAIDADSGEVIHHVLLFENEEPEPLGNEINNYAAPTCALTEDAVYVHFGTYGTARLDPETADVLWSRRDIECRHFRGPGSSPIVVDDLVILTFDGIDQQFLIALDMESGDTIWRVDRTTDYGDLDANGQPTRDGDLRKAYSTPGILRLGDTTQIVSVGSRAAFGYDAKTGEELWTVTHDDYNAAARPIFFDELVIINTGGRGANLTAYRVDQSTRGDITKSNQVWDIPRGNSRLATPLCYEGRIYMVTDRGVVRCVDALTGDVLFEDRIDGNFVASPILANGNLYFCNEEGDTVVIRASDQFEVVSRNELEDGMRASPAAAYGAIYLRTFEHLYKLSNN